MSVISLCWQQSCCGLRRSQGQAYGPVFEGGSDFLGAAPFPFGRHALLQQSLSKLIAGRSASGTELIQHFKRNMKNINILCLHFANRCKLGKKIPFWCCIVKQCTHQHLFFIYSQRIIEMPLSMLCTQKFISIPLI